MPGMSELLVVAFAASLRGIPGYTIGKRRGLNVSWVAFVPFVGLWVG